MRASASGVLGMTLEDYLDALPLARVRDLHVTGVQRFDESWVARVRRAGIPEPEIAAYVGRLLDHLPMTPDDWTILTSLLDRVRRGEAGAPYTATFEYGGVGPLWEAVTDATALREQIPQLRALTQGAG